MQVHQSIMWVMRTTVTLDDDVYEVASVSMMAVEQSSAAHNSASHSHAERDGNEIGYPNCSTAPRLGERDGLRVVVDKGRQPSQRLRLGS